MSEAKQSRGVLTNYYCPDCDAEYHEVWSSEAPICCGEEARVLITRINHFLWGGPKQLIHLRDEPFADRAELDTYAKQNNLKLAESAEKVGGSRNDMYDNVGKIFSGKGMGRKQNSLFSEGVKRA